jgi:quercetin dioxygenase-like cupin family protein
MPRTERQEISVLRAEFAPGQATVFPHPPLSGDRPCAGGHLHLELEGRAPVVVRAGESFVEPPAVRMTGFNRSASERMRVLIFYVSEEGQPFLDPAH